MLIEAARRLGPLQPKACMRWRKQKQVNNTSGDAACQQPMHSPQCQGKPQAQPLETATMKCAAAMQLRLLPPQHTCNTDFTTPEDGSQRWQLYPTVGQGTLQPLHCHERQQGQLQTVAKEQHHADNVQARPTRLAQGFEARLSLPSTCTLLGWSNHSSPGETHQLGRWNTSATDSMTHSPNTCCRSKKHAQHTVDSSSTRATLTTITCQHNHATSL